MLVGIVSRFWFDQSFLWADEAAKLFLSLTTFVGGALAFRARHHTTVEFLTGKFPPRWRVSFAIGMDLLILLAAAVVCDVSLDLISIASTSDTPILQINQAWLVLPLAIGLGLTALFAIERLAYEYPVREIAGAACVVALLAGLVYAASIVPALHFPDGTTPLRHAGRVPARCSPRVAGELCDAAGLDNIPHDQRRGAVDRGGAEHL